MLMQKETDSQQDGAEDPQTAPHIQILSVHHRWPTYGEKKVPGKVGYQQEKMLNWTLHSHHRPEIHSWYSRQLKTNEENKNYKAHITESTRLSS